MSVPLPQNTPLLDAVTVTVGFVLTVALIEEEVTERPAQVIIHLYNCVAVLIPVV